MSFRGNFLVKVAVELLWLGILLIFYRTVFAKTDVVAGWTEHEYLFFVGCYFALESLIETFFLSNCGEFADLIRTGDLDLYLLKPIDEQFLISCQSIDWSTAPSLLMGVGLMTNALVQMGWTPDLTQILGFLALFACGLAMAYSFLLLLTSTSMWFMRNQSLFELWWLVMSLMRYPKEIFAGPLGAPLGWFFTFVVPIMLVINVPARVMVKGTEPTLVAVALAATIALLIASRWAFRSALRRYRSASS
jgi:ABC-2 type transport system permease protein